MQNRRAHVSIIGDNELSREGLKRVLEEGRFRTRCIDISDVYDCIEEFEDEPDHVLLIEAEDVSEAIAASQLLRRHLASARVVLLSQDHDLASVRGVLAMGVDACLARQIACLPLMLILELVALGEKVMPRQAVDELASAMPVFPVKHREDRAPTHDLSNREMGILRCLVDGDPNKVIARKLGITEATVKIHVKGILRKLQVINRTQAAIWVVDHGLFDRSDDIGIPAACLPAVCQPPHYASIS